MTVKELKEQLSEYPEDKELGEKFIHIQAYRHKDSKAISSIYVGDKRIYGGEYLPTIHTLSFQTTFNLSTFASALITNLKIICHDPD